MAETIVTFQTQLSGVMETVFKAAMYEITRLVEESFLEEVTRCREQVEALKRRLKCSESRRKDGEEDHKSRCSDCGRVSFDEAIPKQTEIILKQECELEDDGTISPSKDADLSSSLEATIDIKPSQSGKDNQLKEEEDHHVSATEERWGDCSNEIAATHVPGKRSIDEKCRVNWEASFSSSSESNQNINTSEDLFQNKYAVEDLGGYDKNNYGVAMENIQGSPPHLAEDLSYINQYDGGIDAAEMSDRHSFQTMAQRNRSSAVGSPSRTDASREFSCLLINEEGFLQDHSVMQIAHSSGHQHVVLRGQNQGAHLDTARDMYKCSQTYQEEERKQTCDQSTLSFTDASSIKAHKQTHKGSGQVTLYSCTQCGKTFSQACHLKVHQRIHSGHLCSHCGKAFNSAPELKKHKCGQMSNKPYCCSLCGNKFSRLWNLKLHQRIHTQEKPHQCSMCDKSFTRADILKVHQRTHTGERPYSCMVCGLSFKRLHHLKSHQRKHLTSL